jgi:hypothetical protein
MSRSVLFLLLSVYVATFNGLPDVTDAEAEFQTTSALARTGWLALDTEPTPEAAELVRLEGQGAPVRRGTDGHVYSWFGVGQAIVAVPLYAVGKALERVPAVAALEQAHAARTWYGVERSEYAAHVLVGLRNPLFAALTAMLLARIARHLGASRRRAWLAALAYGLCTFAWPQARATLSDVQATFFLFAAFGLVLRVREATERLRRPARVDLLAFGLCLGLAFLTRISTAPVVAVLIGAGIAVGLRGRRFLLAAGERPRPLLLDAALALGPAVLCFGLWLALNRARFGHPLESGYSSGVGASFFSYPVHLGLAGLLLSPGKGLLWFAPGLVLLPLGLRHALKRGERLWPWTLLLVAVAVFLPAACMPGWHGAWTYGPRYLLPALPLLWLGVALAFQELQDHPARFRTALGITAAGLLTSLPGVFVDHATHEDLGLQAAQVAWAGDVPAGVDERTADEAHFLRLHWEWRTAAPWAHWRILRHRLSLQNEQFTAAELYGLEVDTPLTPRTERGRGFLHLCWVDLDRNLGGARWPGFALSFVLLTAGAVMALRGLDPTVS